jgi:hypothetical protein
VFCGGEGARSWGGFESQLGRLKCVGEAIGGCHY